MKDGTLDVHVLGISARQNPEHENIDEEPRNGDAKHRTREDNMRFLKALPGFIDNPDDDRE